MFYSAGLVTGSSCVNVQRLDELRGLLWKRAGGSLTVSRENIWECNEQFEYLNSTPKFRNVKLDMSLKMAKLEPIIKLQTSNDLHKYVIYFSRSRAEILQRLNI